MRHGKQGGKVFLAAFAPERHVFPNHFHEKDKPNEGETPKLTFLSPANTPPKSFSFEIFFMVFLAAATWKTYGAWTKVCLSPQYLDGKKISSPVGESGDAHPPLPSKNFFLRWDPQRKMGVSFGIWFWALFPGFFSFCMAACLVKFVSYVSL